MLFLLCNTCTKLFCTKNLEAKNDLRIMAMQPKEKELIWFFLWGLYIDSGKLEFRQFL